MHCTIVFFSASGIEWLNRFGNRLDPIEKTMSALRRKCSASEPRTPTDSGWFSGNAPLAFSVVSTGTCAISANFSSSARRVGVHHALADVEQGILGREQRAHRRLHVVRVGTGAPALDRRVGMLVGVVLAEVARNDQQHRARAGRSADA